MGKPIWVNDLLLETVQPTEVGASELSFASGRELLVREAYEEVLAQLTGLRPLQSTQKPSPTGRDSAVVGESPTSLDPEAQAWATLVGDATSVIGKWFLDTVYTDMHLSGHKDIDKTLGCREGWRVKYATRPFEEVYGLLKRALQNEDERLFRGDPSTVELNPEQDFTGSLSPDDIPF